MKYVFPNNLMVRRCENREVIKGAILAGVVVLLILILFLTSDYMFNSTTQSTYMRCINVNGQAQCFIE